MSHRSVSPRTRPSACLLLTLAFTGASLALLGFADPAQAQTSPPTRTVSVGPNINMVSGTTLPDGDPFLQRQNEPSIAISTRNPCHLLAGANDYRTVDMPGLPDDKENGDAWLGLFKSFDCGKTWKSTLLPGYPQDTTAAGLASPLKGLAAGADPIVRAGTNGLFYYSGIVFNRGAKAASRVFVARFLDSNLDVDTQGRPVDPIDYVGTSVVDVGTPGQFVDKPSIAGDIPRNGKMCSVGGQTLPAGTVYIVYSTFLGDPANGTTKLLVSQSNDCGATWTKSVKISEGAHTNQGAAIAVAPNGNVYVAWRQFAFDTQPNAILVSRSTDFGRTFSKAARVATIAPFDQGTTTASFRTNAYPTLAIDGQNRVYLAWSARGFDSGRPDFSTGDARIVMSTSSDGLAWSMPRAVDNPAVNPLDPYASAGHQIMPALSFAAGRLQLIYYDLRDDHTYLDYYVSAGNTYNPTGTRVLTGDRKDGHPEKVFWQRVADAAPDGSSLTRRHSVDVRGAQAGPGAVPAFTSWPISQYAFGVTDTTIEQVQFNPPNLPLYAKGTAPFFGDYIDVAGLSFVPTSSGGWAFNTEVSGPQVFHAVWTDNRDVRPPIEGQTWASYTPPTSSATTVQCVPGTTGMRNSNVYTAQIAPALVVGSPENAKGLHATIPRAFPVVVRNETSVNRSYRLTLGFDSGVVRASFVEAPFQTSATSPAAAPVTVLDVTVAAMSSIARTVFVTAPQPDAQVTVNVSEIDRPQGTLMPDGNQAVLVLNDDRSNPAVMNPAVMNPAVMNQLFNPAVMNPAVMNPAVMNPAVMNPAVMNPAVMNPAVMNPAVMNPAVMNPAVMNPAVMNPAVMNPAVMNPTVANPAVMNPAVMNIDLANVSLTDVTWTVKNTGTSAGSFSAKLLLKQPLPQGFKAQLIVHKSQVTPASRLDCTLGQWSQDSVITNIIDPRFTDLGGIPSGALADPNILDPSIENATFALAAGEEVRVTLRIVDPNKWDNQTVVIDGREVSVDPLFDPIVAVVPAVVSQAVNVVGGVVPPQGTPPPAVLPSTLVFAQEPTTVGVNAFFSPPVQVRALDAAGAPVAGVTIALSLATNPGGAVLAGATATTDGFGTATFNNLTLSAVGPGYTLRAASGTLTPVVSVPFDVITPNPAPLGPGSRRLTRLVTDQSLPGLPTNLARPSSTLMNEAGDYLYIAGRGGNALFFRRAGASAATRLLQAGDPVPGIAGSSIDYVVAPAGITPAGGVRVEVEFYRGRGIEDAILAFEDGQWRTVVYSEDFAPGGGGVKFERFVSFVGVNASGDTAFTAPLVPGPGLIGYQAHTTLYIAPMSGRPIRLVGMGDVAPDTGGGTLSGISGLAINDLGDVLFRAAIDGGTGGAGLFVASRTGVRKVAANGDSDLLGGTFASSQASWSGHLDQAGRVAFGWYSTLGPATYVSVPGSPLAVLIGPSAADQLRSGATFTSLGCTSGPSDVFDAACYARLTGGGPAIYAVFRYAAASPYTAGTLTEIVAQSGQAAPGVAGKVLSGFSGISVNDAGVVSFPASFSLGGTGLFRQAAQGGLVTVVAYDGQASVLGGTLSVAAASGLNRLNADGSLYYEAGLIGVDASYAAFLSRVSGPTTVMLTNADPLPAGSRVTMRNVLMNAAGDLVEFSANRTGGPATLFLHDIVSGTTTKVVSDGDPAPGGGQLFDPSAASGTANLNAAGTVAFVGTPLGGVTTLYVWTAGGGVQKVVAINDVAPSTSTTISAITFQTSGTPRINAGSQIVYWARLGGVPSSSGLFTAGPAGKVVMVGETLPSPMIGTFTDVSGYPYINATGDVAFMATISVGGVGGTGIFVGTPCSPAPCSSALAKVVATGDSFAGSTFSAVSTYRGAVGFNDVGEVLFFAGLADGRWGLFLGSGGSPPQAIALNGSAAPAGGSYNFTPPTSRLMDARINAAGDILFVAALTGGSADSGLFLRRASLSPTFETIALQGQAAPGTTGYYAGINQTLNSIPGEFQVLGPDGDVVFFNAVLVDPTTYGRGMFRYRTDRTVELLLLRADPMPDDWGGLVGAITQNPGVGGPGRFFFRVGTLDSAIADGIYMTFLPGDPPPAPEPAAPSPPTGAPWTGPVCDPAPGRVAWMTPRAVWFAASTPPSSSGSGHETGGSSKQRH